MFEMIDNPILIKEDFDYIGTGNILRAKNPKESIFKVIGESLKVSINAVIVDGHQTLIEYNDSGQGTLWMLGCKAPHLICGFSPNSSIVVVGCIVAYTNFLDNVTSLNKITFNNYGWGELLHHRYDYRIGGTNHILHNEPTPNEVLTFQLKKCLINSDDYIITDNDEVRYIGGFSGNQKKLNLSEKFTVWDCCDINNTEGVPKESIFVNCHVGTYSTDCEDFLFINPYSSSKLDEPIKFDKRKKGTW
tara:strand:- start:5577 stop:6317 length:741 start_codon:yes stop_codon:yes gene_type:complete